jgi:hypothetical protein
MRAAMARTTTTAFLSPTLPTYTTSTAAAPFSSSSPDARANVLRRHAVAKPTDPRQRSPTPTADQPQSRL